MRDCEMTSGEVNTKTPADLSDEELAEIPQAHQHLLRGNGRISPCACRCVGSLGLRTHSQKSWLTTRRQSPCTTCTTTSAACIRRCASRPQWKQGLRIVFGQLKNWLVCWRSHRVDSIQAQEKPACQRVACVSDVSRWSTLLQ
jgi:hypothetical protein